VNTKCRQNYFKFSNNANSFSFPISVSFLTMQTETQKVPGTSVLTWKMNKELRWTLVLLLVTYYHVPFPLFWTNPTRFVQGGM